MSPDNDKPKSTDSANTFDEISNGEDGASTAMLNAETYGQQLDDNNASGQEKSDEMDDSLRMDIEEMTKTGPAAASDENIPKELTDPSDRAFTLPEEQGPN